MDGFAWLEAGQCHPGPITRPPSLQQVGPCPVTLSIPGVRVLLTRPGPILIRVHQCSFLGWRTDHVAQRSPDSAQLGWQVWVKKQGKLPSSTFPETDLQGRPAYHCPKERPGSRPPPFTTGLLEKLGRTPFRGFCRLACWIWPHGETLPSLSGLQCLW